MKRFKSSRRCPQKKTTGKMLRGEYCIASDLFESPLRDACGPTHIGKPWPNARYAANASNPLSRQGIRMRMASPGSSLISPPE